MYRTVDVNMEIPTTPRKLIAYINEIPNILEWKQAVINHAINLNYYHNLRSPPPRN